MAFRQSRAGWPRIAALALIATGVVARTEASPPQDPPLGSSAPNANLPQVPAPSTPPPPDTPPAPPGSREAQLEERIRQLESMVNRLATQVDTMTPAPGAAPGAAAGAAPAGPGGGGGPDGDPGGVPTTGSTGVPTGLAGSSTTTGGALAPGQSVTAVPAASDKYNMPAPNRKDPLKAIFGPGFMLKSDDDEYVLQFHNLTQIEYRGYEQGGQNPVHDTFAIPRQWYMFSGRITKPFEYFVSFQQAFDVILPLDIFANINYDPRLQLRIGRFKTPFTYEFFHEPIQGLINPERSLFFNNFALNRQVGAMLWGQLFDRKLDYAVGIFNSTRNGFVDTSDGKDFLGYLGYRPFQQAEDFFLQFLEIGGSVDVGNQVNVPLPPVLRTNVATTGTNVVGTPFLAFNSNVREAGQHAFWSPHLALYRNQLSLVAEYQAGFQDYAQVANLKARTNLPIQSFYVMGGYFLTGETVTNRNIVKPLRPFSFKNGEWGPGAFELTGRYNYLNVGDQVFSAGLADQNLWSNQVTTIDVGFNWYPTQYTKVMFTWEHAMFGTPVQYAPGKLQLTSDMFWLRYQLFF